MPSISVEIEVYCARCGAGICGNTSVGKTKGRGMDYFEVEPCSKCLENEKDDGDSEGYDRGHKDGYKEGYEEAKKEFEVKP